MLLEKNKSITKPSLMCINKLQYKGNIHSKSIQTKHIQNRLTQPRTENVETLVKNH